MAALLTARTISEAASEAGIGGRTLERWLSEDPSFVAEYRAARRRVVEAAVSQLQNATVEAVDCLTRNLHCGTPSSEVRAASVILDHALKAVELYELESRLQFLEDGGEA